MTDLTQWERKSFLQCAAMKIYGFIRTIKNMEGEDKEAEVLANRKQVTVYVGTEICERLNLYNEHRKRACVQS